MKAALERAGSHFTIFGGEPLLVPEHVLEELWAFGLERFGRNGIQTNGTLINDRHIAFFKRYSVSVGISVDGPDDLNDVRWAGSVELTRRGDGENACRDRTAGAGGSHAKPDCHPSPQQRDGRQAAQDERLVPLPRHAGHHERAAP